MSRIRRGNIKGEDGIQEELFIKGICVIFRKPRFLKVSHVQRSERCSRGKETHPNPQHLASLTNAMKLYD